MLDGLRIAYGWTNITSGVSTLRLKKLSGELLIRICGDETYDRSLNDDNSMKIVIPAPADWRDICNAIINTKYASAYITDGDTSGGYAWPHLMTVNRPRTLAITMICWAWAGPPLAELSRLLHPLADTKLRKLLAALGPFNERKDFERLIDWNDLLAAENVSLADVLAQVYGPPSRRDLRKTAINLLRQKRRIAAQQADDRALATMPYRALIEAAAEQLAGPIKGSLHVMWSRGRRVDAIRAFLEDYIHANKKFPSGQHRISDLDGTVDFSHALQPAEGRAPPLIGKPSD